MYRFAIVLTCLFIIAQPGYAQPYDGLEKIGQAHTFQDEKKATLEVMPLQTKAGTHLVGLYFGDAHVYFTPGQWREFSGLLQWGSQHWDRLDYSGVDGVRQFIGYQVKTVGTVTPQLEGALRTPEKRLVLVATGKYATADFKRFVFSEELLKKFVSTVGSVDRDLGQ
jgi:hypothetical protein